MRRTPPKTFRRWVAGVIVAGAVVLAMGYASSYRFRELSRGVVRGYRVDFIHLGDPLANRVVVSRSPLIVADHYSGGSGPLVVLVHGSVSTGRRYAGSRLVADRLVRAGFPVRSSMV